MLSGNSNAAARVINAARLGATVLACRLIFGAKVARIEELASAIVRLFNLLDILEIDLYCFMRQCAFSLAFILVFWKNMHFFVGEK